MSQNNIEVLWGIKHTTLNKETHLKINLHIKIIHQTFRNNTVHSENKHKKCHKKACK